MINIVTALLTVLIIIFGIAYLPTIIKTISKVFRVLFGNKDPYHVFRKGKAGESKLDRNRRRKKLRNLWFSRWNDKRYAEKQRVHSHLVNGLCPVCESRISKRDAVDDNHPDGCTIYECAACDFKYEDVWDDEDECMA